MCLRYPVHIKRHGGWFHNFPETRRAIVSLDIGTSSTRASIHDERGVPGGSAPLALQSLGRLSDLRAVQAPLGVTVEPDARRHTKYHDALERQRRLDAKV